MTTTGPNTSAGRRGGTIVEVTAYWINTFTRISDEGRVRRYAELAGPAMEAAGGRFLARGNPEYAFEQAELLRTTLIEFPSAEAARAAYESAAYQAALGVLGDGAQREIRIIKAIADETDPSLGF